jgi:hypothetical protein
MPKPRTIKDAGRVKKFQTFLADGFADYIAARVLLRSQLPKQGAILSSTAIEKCFKAILAFNGQESHGHLKTAHWNAVKSFDKRLFSDLDLGFIELNKKAYQLRYTDSLPPGFNLIIVSREFLAELDHTVSRIFAGFTVEDRGKRRQLAYDAALNSHDHRLVDDNHVIANQDKKAFIAKVPDFVYEM